MKAGSRRFKSGRLDYFFGLSTGLSAALNALQLHEKPVLQNAVDAPPPRDT